MKNILVVEDSSTVTKVIRHLLSHQPDLQGVYAESFEAAKQILENDNSIFAALVDLNLPDAPNGEVVDYVLAKKIPTIVLTGNFSDETREELLNKGIVDYVVKESRYSYQFAVNLVRRL